MAARCYTQRKASGWVTDRVQDIAETGRLARRAQSWGVMTQSRSARPELPSPMSSATSTTAQTLRIGPLALNPNLAWAWLYSGWVKVWIGEPEFAIERVARAMRLSHMILNFLACRAPPHSLISCWPFCRGAVMGRSSGPEQPNYILATSIAAASGALARRLVDAEKAMARLLNSSPRCAFQSSRSNPRTAFGRFRSLTEGLRRAGLPSDWARSWRRSRRRRQSAPV